MSRPPEEPLSTRERLALARLSPLVGRPNRPARIRKERTEIRELLDKKAKGILRERIAAMHPADLAEYLRDLSASEVRTLLGMADDAKVAGVLKCADEEGFQLHLARAVGKERLTEILEAMPSDEVVDLLARFDPEELDRVLDEMDAEDAAEVKQLLGFAEETAGGLMAVELISFRPGMTGSEVVERIRRYKDQLETVNYLYITAEEGPLVGVLSLRELLLAPPDRPIGEYMERDVIRVHVADDQETVASLVSKYDLLAVPVVDDTGCLKGIVTVDDILDVLEDEATEDMFGMAGLSRDEAEEESALKSAIRRLPWLLFTLVGGFFSGFVLSWFQGALHKAVALAVFIPSIMGLGGNIAVQSSTLVVRGFATGDLDEERVLPLLFKEIRVGILLGVLLGSAAGALGYLWLGNPYLGLVVTISMLGQFTVAATNGTFVPWVLRRGGADPALASGPFVTMVSDWTGLMIYFGLASLCLEWLAV